MAAPPGQRHGWGRRRRPSRGGGGPTSGRGGLGEDQESGGEGERGGDGGGPVIKKKEGAIRDVAVTGVQSCALPISEARLGETTSPFAWRGWSYEWQARPGR